MKQNVTYSKKEKELVKNNMVHVKKEKAVQENDTAEMKKPVEPVKKSFVALKKILIQPKKAEGHVKKDTVHLSKEKGKATKEERSVKKEEVQAKIEAEPIKKEGISVKKEALPGKKEEVPVKKDEVSRKKEEIPVEKAEVPGKKEETPAKEGKVHMKREDTVLKSSPELSSSSSQSVSQSSSNKSSPLVEFSFVLPRADVNDTARLSVTASEDKKLVAAESVAVTAVSRSRSNDSVSPVNPSVMLDDDEPIILSAPACQVLEIIRLNGLFSTTAGTEQDNELIRSFFAGKARDRECDAYRAIEKAVDLAVTRVKSMELTSNLYNFLTFNRDNAISLMIDAMKYRKKDFLPDFWDLDRMPKK